MRILSAFLLLSLLASSLWAQTPGVVTAIKTQALQNPEGVPGSVIVSDIKNGETGDEDCSEVEPGKEWKLIFTGEYNPGAKIKVGTEEIDSPSLSKINPSRLDYQNLKDKSSAEIMLLSTQITSSGENPLFSFGNMLLLGASQMYDPARANDKDYSASVADWMSNRIKDLNLTKQDQIKLISSISSSLYHNYNDPRNVTSESDNNPRYWATQAFGLFTSSTSNNYGGVCDDISFLGCDLYQKLNPQDDCLTMHQAGVGGIQHFVMLMGNKGTRDYTTVDGSTIDQTQGANYLSVHADDLGGNDHGINTRLNRVFEGKHQSIALVKNEYGQWMEKTMSVEGKPGQSVVQGVDGTIMQSLGAAFEIKKKNEETQKKTTYGVNQGTLSSQAQVVAVYALIDKTKPKSKMGIGLGYSFTNFSPREKVFTYNDQNFGHTTLNQVESITATGQAHRLHINPYLGFGNTYQVKKGNHQFNIHYLNGVYANILGGFGSSEYTDQLTTTWTNQITGQVTNKTQNNKTLDGGIIFDGNLGLSQQVGVNYTNKASGTDAMVQLQVTEELGPDDWNRVHGLQTKTLESLSNMTFFLNRVEVNTQVNQQLNPKTTLMGNVQYLGTNVGQNLLTRMGVQFQIPHDMQVFVLTSYGAEFRGYKTKQNYLPVSSQSGLSLMGGISNDKGLNLGVGVRIDPKSVTTPVTPQVRATIPLTKKKSKVRSTASGSMN